MKKETIKEALLKQLFGKLFYFNSVLNVVGIVFCIANVRILKDGITPELTQFELTIVTSLMVFSFLFFIYFLRYLVKENFTIILGTTFICISLLERNVIFNNIGVILIIVGAIGSFIYAINKIKKVRKNENRAGD